MKSNCQIYEDRCPIREDSGTLILFQGFPIYTDIPAPCHTGRSQFSLLHSRSSFHEQGLAHNLYINIVSPLHDSLISNEPQRRVGAFLEPSLKDFDVHAWGHNESCLPPIFLTNRGCLICMLRILGCRCTDSDHDLDDVIQRGIYLLQLRR